MIRTQEHRSSARLVQKLVWSVLATVLLFAATGSSAWAQDADPPSRVARLNYMQGTVSFQPDGGGDNDWVGAELNRPITTGDRVWTDQDGRAELHVGSTAIRLDHDSGISFLSLSDNFVQVQLSAGSMIIRLRHLDPNDNFEIDAPNLAFSLLQPGDYRVDVDPNNNVTVAAVFQGRGEVTGGGRSYQITADQRATFTGTDSLDYNLVDADANPLGEFDSWATHRDRDEDRLNSTNYVSAEVTGVSDLDSYGKWQTVPDYGPMWFPGGVAVGWAPYRLGHWAWIQPWGWTWVDDEPWGFAPFHYGRWAFVSGNWGWVPGPIIARPVYAPALVAWVGGTPGFNFSITIGGGGGVGWFPLGPREVFVPSYRVSDTYVTRVNVSNTVVDRVTVVNIYHNTDVRNVTYVNQRVGGGVTVVSHDAFVNARPVGRNVVNVPERELAAAPVSRGFAAAPVRASMVGEGRTVAARPPAAILNRTVVTKRPPIVQRGPGRFEQQGSPANGQPAFRPQGQSASPNQSAPNQPAVLSRPPARFEQQGNPGGGRSSQQPPVLRQQGQSPVPNQPAPPVQPSPNQPSIAARPPVRLEEQGTPSSRQQSQPPQPQQPPPTFRPSTPSATPQQPSAPLGNGRNSGDVNQQSSRPPSSFARPAPPVHQPTPVEQKNDAGKEKAWQQQHEEVHRGKDKDKR